MPAGVCCSSFISGYATVESLSYDMLCYATFRLMLGKWCKTLIIMRAVRGHNEINQVGDSLPFCGPSKKNLAWFMVVWSRSAASTKRRGERGSPCLTPRLQWNVLPGTLFRSTTEVPLEKMLLIQCSHFSPKPMCSIICNIAWCSTLSEAFSKSNLRMIISFLEWWQRCRYSKA